MNTFGSMFRCTTWGESHGEALGVVIDGCPAGTIITEDLIAAELKRDVPIRALGTPRKEDNNIKIKSGVYDKRSIGTPISIEIPNNNQRSHDYSQIETVYRPGHGEIGYHSRYGAYDYRGGGRASGRECIARLAAGAVAKQVLDELNIKIESSIIELDGVKIENDTDMNKAIRHCLEIWDEDKQSTGGVVEIVIKNVPAGVGNPVFGKLNATIMYALATIGGVKGVEQGLGFTSARVYGTQCNDGYEVIGNKIKATSNKCGGTVAGISNGSDLVFRLAVKPTPSLTLSQKTVNWKEMKEVDLAMKGRFDANFTPRVAVVAESMAAMAVLDQLLMSGFTFDNHR